jgi:hypothetical protein
MQSTPLTGSDNSSTERQRQQHFLRALYKNIYPDPIPEDSSGLTHLDLVVAGPPHQVRYQPKFLLSDKEVISLQPITLRQIIKRGYPNRGRTGTTQHIQVDSQSQATTIPLQETTTKTNIS